MASFCWKPQVYSGQTSGWWITGGWITAHQAIRLSSPSSSLTMAWRMNGRMVEWLRSLRQCFLSTVMNSLKLRESKSYTRLRFVFHAFFCPVITDNYGYQVAISGLHAFRLIWLEKFASLLEMSLKPDWYCWQMMVRVIPICSICLNGKIHKCKNSPLMAGGGDSVPRVILLSFPQTGAGGRFEALISMFQQAWDKHKLFRWWRQSYSCLKITVEEKLLPAASGHPELNDFVNYNFHEETDS